uniref:Uncharacterized protein n=1 Tax=Spongospora subterranea TaxID=70186 RepID=A0A0H5RA20_9EUKA|eukprot:CRZ05269.1 hypothetical protein [Spongospora subterranea]
MFLIGEASSWIWGTTMKSAGICCLSAIAAGQMQGGIFMYSHQFGEKAPKTNHQHWFSKQSLWNEGISIITLGAILILSAVCLIWQSVFLPANQAFALASGAFAYIGAFGYAVFLKLHLYSKEHLAMGALTGMMSDIGIIAARWCIRTASFAD